MSSSTLVALLVFCMVVSAAPAAMAKSRWAQRVELKVLAGKATNNSLRYLHTTWWKSRYSYRSIEITHTGDATETLRVANPWGGFAAGEAPIRSQGSALYATAIALRNRTYSERAVKVTRGEATRRVVAWSNGLAYSYEADGWGHRFQSALWVYYLGFGARQVWSSVPAETRGRIDAAIISEADYLLTKPPPFYRGASGDELIPGDSKAEENAWNGALLMLAARALPNNPHAAQWEAQGRAYGLTAYSTPSQVGSDPRLTGSNLNPDGSITNHRRPVSPDYMMAQNEFIAKNALLAAVTKTTMSREIANNQALVWRALRRVKYSPPKFKKPGGPIYRVNSKRAATANLYFPSGTSFGTRRKFNAAQTDVEVFAAKNIDSAAYSFAKAHLKALLKQQARHKDGRVFAKGETGFPEDEQFAAVSAAEMTWRLMLMR
jgi:hypothetical protein